MPRINRRALFLGSTSAVIASIAVDSALAGVPRHRGGGPSGGLRELIKAHEAAYATFGRVLREPGSQHRDHAQASRDEEVALLAVCSYPAVSESDRRAKARYLLKIEARGELDLREHMQAVLRAIM